MGRLIKDFKPNIHTQNKKLFKSSTI